MARFVAVPSENGEILVNPDQVRMLVTVGPAGNRTQIVFDENHVAYSNLSPAELAERFSDSE